MTKLQRIAGAAASRTVLHQGRCECNQTCSLGSMTAFSAQHLTSAHKKQERSLASAMQSRAKCPLPPHLKHRSPASSKSSSKYLIGRGAQRGWLETLTAGAEGRLTGFSWARHYNSMLAVQCQRMSPSRQQQQAAKHLGSRNKRATSAFRSSAVPTRMTPVGAFSGSPTFAPLLLLLLSLPETSTWSKSRNEPGLPFAPLWCASVLLPRSPPGFSWLPSSAGCCLRPAGATSPLSGDDVFSCRPSGPGARTPPPLPPPPSRLAVSAAALRRSAMSTGCPSSSLSGELLLVPLMVLRRHARNAW